MRRVFKREFRRKGDLIFHKNSKDEANWVVVEAEVKWLPNKSLLTTTVNPSEKNFL